MRAAIFVLVFAVHALSPRTTSGDSRWTVPVALSILDHGDTNLDEYAALLERDHYYAVDRVDGHYYSHYPVAVPALSLPFVLTLRSAAPVLKALVPARLTAAHPEFAALAAGDLVRAHAVVEEWIASFFVALAAVVMFAVARRFLPVSLSLVLTFTLAFATPAWSSGSRAFGQHAPSMFLVALALYLLVAAAAKPAIVPCLGLVVAAAFALRPINALLVIAVSACVFERYRSRFLPYLLWSLPVAIPFLAYNLAVYHRLFPPYFTTGSGSGEPGSFPLQFASALAGEIASPSRGLLVFTPVLLFSLWGIVLAWRRRWQNPLARYLTLWLATHWLVISLYVNFWWAGHSYGPRFFTDLAPVFVFFLIPAVEAWRQAGSRRPAAAAFLLLLAASAFIHARGAWSLDAQNWSATPTDVDQDRSRLWDWRDPQFLRGFHR